MQVAAISGSFRCPEGLRPCRVSSLGSPLDPAIAAGVPCNNLQVLPMMQALFTYSVQRPGCRQLHSSICVVHVLRGKSGKRSWELATSSGGWPCQFLSLSAVSVPGHVCLHICRREAWYPTCPVGGATDMLSLLHVPDLSHETHTFVLSAAGNAERVLPRATSLRTSVVL